MKMVLTLRAPGIRLWELLFCDHAGIQLGLPVFLKVWTLNLKDHTTLDIFKQLFVCARTLQPIWIRRLGEHTGSRELLLEVTEWPGGPDAVHYIHQVSTHPLLQWVLPLAFACLQWAWALLKLLDWAVRCLNGDILGQSLHTAAAALQRLFLRLSTELHTKHAALALWKIKCHPWVLSAVG